MGQPASPASRARGRSDSAANGSRRQGGKDSQGSGRPSGTVGRRRDGAEKKGWKREAGGGGRFSDSSWVLHAKRRRSWLRSLGRRVPRDSTLIICMEHGGGGMPREDWALAHLYWGYAGLGSSTYI